MAFQSCSRIGSLSVCFDLMQVSDNAIASQSLKTNLESSLKLFYDGESSNKSELRELEWRKRSYCTVSLEIGVRESSVTTDKKIKKVTMFLAV